MTTDPKSPIILDVDGTAYIIPLPEFPKELLQIVKFSRNNDEKGAAIMRTSNISYKDYMIAVEKLGYQRNMYGKQALLVPKEKDGREILAQLVTILEEMGASKNN